MVFKSTRKKNKNRNKPLWFTAIIFSLLIYRYRLVLVNGYIVKIHLPVPWFLLLPCSHEFEIIFIGSLLNVQARCGKQHNNLKELDYDHKLREREKIVLFYIYFKFKYFTKYSCASYFCVLIYVFNFIIMIFTI